MEIEGKIIQVLPLQQGTSPRGEWQKQDFILETQDQYPKKVCISVWNKKFEVEPYLNAPVKVFINIESREFKDRWYTDVKAWKIESLADADSDSALPPSEAVENDRPVNEEDGEELEDLPF